MRLFFCIFFLYLTAPAQGQEDYILKINDSSIHIATGKEYTVTVNGKPARVSLNIKDTLLYSDSFYSFRYPSGVKVSKTKLEEGIEQISILTAEGSGFIIQKYESMNPSTLNELMLTELCKESITYGFTSNRSNYTRKTSTGQILTVTRALLTYKEDVNLYEVASYGKKDNGIMIVTLRMDNTPGTEGQKIIDLMWRSLKITL